MSKRKSRINSGRDVKGGWRMNSRLVAQNDELIILSVEEQIAFVHMLLNPPAPGVRLQLAVAAYREITGR